MNLWQMARQARYQLKNRSWPDGGELIFPTGSVVVSQLPVEIALAELKRLPAAAIRIGSRTPDPKHGQSNDIFQGSLGITLAVAVAGDPLGQDPLLGAHRQALTQSDGRGLLEVEEEILDEINEGNIVCGLGAKFLGATVPEPVLDDREPSIVYCSYAYSVSMTRQRGYFAADNFTAADATGGDCALAWSLPPSRFDLLSMILRRASGTAAPATHDAGTAVTLGSLLATSHTDSPGAGTWSYSLFAAYDEALEVGESGRSANRYSAARTQTVTVT